MEEGICSFMSRMKGWGSDRWWEWRWWLWWGDMHRMRWTRRRVNTMRLTERRKELIPQMRWRISKSERWWFVMRKIQMVELGWQQMRSEHYALAVHPRSCSFGWCPAEGYRKGNQRCTMVSSGMGGTFLTFLLISKKVATMFGSSLCEIRCITLQMTQWSCQIEPELWVVYTKHCPHLIFHKCPWF